MTEPTASDEQRINTNDQPYRRVAFSGPTLAGALRLAADWLDDAAEQLGEVVFVAATNVDIDDDLEFSLFVYADEFPSSTPQLAQ